jgi:hypothetical protein
LLRNRGIFYPNLARRKKNDQKKEIIDSMRTFNFLASRHVVRERDRIKSTKFKTV